MCSMRSENCGPTRLFPGQVVPQRGSPAMFLPAAHGVGGHRHSAPLGRHGDQHAPIGYTTPSCRSAADLKLCCLVWRSPSRPHVGDDVGGPEAPGHLGVGAEGGQQRLGGGGRERQLKRPACLLTRPSPTPSIAYRRPSSWSCPPGSHAARGPPRAPGGRAPQKHAHGQSHNVSRVATLSHLTRRRRRRTRTFG